MNKEKYNKIIDEAYDNYRNKKGSYIYEGPGGIPTIYTPLYINGEPQLLTKEEFIRLIKTDTEFSEKWGLKIEERELSLEERKRIYEIEYTNDIEVENNHWLESKLKTRNIPTKQITLEYNNEKTYYYE